MSIRAFVDYVKIAAEVEPQVPALNIVAHVFPRIRAVIEQVTDVHAVVGESKFIITYSVWDAGNSKWDKNLDGVPQTRWDIQLR